ncbi:lipase maturation factor 1-like isoform X2 [Dreissena polymorpha]|uniref:lipase maturation factor 1-like isoform X2 n=1 Tax=Dreissena polymorpha TaxID=45954 RepID=UPI0022648D07|nr:lipase maturation factor 1-like isoform X2 [Dreissena polymorpha]
MENSIWYHSNTIAHTVIAFLVALQQNKELLGLAGLLPANHYLDNIKQHSGGINWSAFLSAPSLVWLIDYHVYLDYFLDYVAYAGLGLSGFLIINGGANWIIMFTLWVLYHSLVNIGQRWYGFGWESQLLETGFLAVFLCPMLSVSAVPKSTPTSQIVIWANRWLIFRIMLGAGLIKIRGDQCWRDLTCMNYHYETQPVPNPMSYFMHQSPEWFHKFETLSNHFVELMAPALLLLPAPRRLRFVGGVIQILFQVVLIISGNLSFLNWLTIVPSLACFDDRGYAWMFSRSRIQQVAAVQAEGRDGKTLLTPSNYIRRVFNISLGLLIAYLSVPVIQNLMSSRQQMNTSFDSFRLVNTYGAFGSVTKERTEVIYQGTYGHPNQKETIWEEYEFKCKPGKITRRPCIISPYHYRLDWLLWFAAFQNYQHNPWIVTMAAKLLTNDNSTLSLIAHNPFEGKDPPTYVRVQLYSYKYTKVGSNDAIAGRWWKRRYIREYLQPVNLQSLKPYLDSIKFNVATKQTKKAKKKQ